MRRLLAVMFGLLGFASVLLVLAVSQPADAHTKYCGHGAKYWAFTSPTSGAVIYYREVLVDSWGAGPHIHHTKSQVKKYTKLGSYWATIHEHYRGCIPHAV